MAATFRYDDEDAGRRLMMVRVSWLMVVTVAVLLLLMQSSRVYAGVPSPDE